VTVVLHLSTIFLLFDPFTLSPYSTAASFGFDSHSFPLALVVTAAFTSLLHCCHCCHYFILFIHPKPSFTFCPDDIDRTFLNCTFCIFETPYY
jgi:hypothetical protein